MSKWVNRVKDLKQKAIDVKAALDQAPETIAQIRHSVESTKEQLQQLKSDVEQGAQDLIPRDLPNRTSDLKSVRNKEESSEKKVKPTEAPTQSKLNISDAIRELNASRLPLQKAGYLVSRVKVSPQSTHPLQITIQLHASLSVLALQKLRSEFSQQPFTKALIESLIQAEGLTRSYAIHHLSPREVKVKLGQSTSFSVIWEEQNVFEPRPESRPKSTLTPAQPSAIEARPGLLPDMPIADAPQMTHAIESSLAALDRFKTNPKFSKYKG